MVKGWPQCQGWASHHGPEVVRIYLQVPAEQRATRNVPLHDCRHRRSVPLFIPQRACIVLILS